MLMTILYIISFGDNIIKKFKIALHKTGQHIKLKVRFIKIPKCHKLS